MDNYTFYLANSLEKVFLNKRVDELKNKNITALVGEKYSFQLVYFAKNTDFVNDKQCFELDLQTNGIPFDCFDVQVVPSTYPTTSVYDSDYITTEPGLFPDLLTPSNSIIRPIKNQYKSCWINLDLSNIEANTYNIEISATAIKEIKLGNGNVVYSNVEDNYKETLFLTVIPAEKKDLSIVHTQWFHVDGLLNYYNQQVYSEENWKTIANYINFAAKNCKVNTLLTPIITPSLDTMKNRERLNTQLVDIEQIDEELYYFNFDKLLKWCSICKKAGIKNLEISHFFTQWGAYYTPNIYATVNNEYKRIFGWDIKATDVRYSKFLKALIKPLLGALKKGGYDKDHLFFHISDEPRYEHINSYKNARNVIKPLLKGYIIIDALSDYEFYKLGLVDTPVVANDKLQDFYNNKVKNLWTYYCVAQSKGVPNRFLAMKSSRNRIMGILLYLYEIKGFLHWGFNFYNSAYSINPINPFIDTTSHNAFPSGDAYLVYPGDDKSPLSSIRNEVQVDCFQDLMALKYLESLTSREYVVELIHLGIPYKLSFFQYPKNNNYILELKERINLKIQELQE